MDEIIREIKKLSDKIKSNHTKEEIENGEAYGTEKCPKCFGTVVYRINPYNHHLIVMCMDNTCDMTYME